MVDVQLVHEKGNPLSDLAKKRVEKVISQYKGKVKLRIIDSESEEAKKIMQHRRIFMVPILMVNNLTQDIGPPNEEDIKAEIEAAIREERE